MKRKDPNESDLETFKDDWVGKWQMREGHVKNTLKTQQKFLMVMDATKSKKIFEIGFNGGHSARMFLRLGAEKVHSIDICKHEYSEPIARDMERMDNKFSFENKSSFDLQPSDLQGYDMLFIDGDHEYESIYHDVKLGIDAGIRTILFDDYIHTNTHGGWFDSGNSLDKVMEELKDTGYEITTAPIHYDTIFGAGILAVITKVR